MREQFSVFDWNVRGLNGRARRDVVREFILLHRPSFVSLQETKLQDVPQCLANEILGLGYGYEFFPAAAGAAGGLLLAWRSDRWSVSSVIKNRFFISVQVADERSEPWWVSAVYGPPQDEADKVQFLHELVQFRAGTSGAWLLSGDFNMIHRASDKSNGRLDRRGMRRFRNFINQAQLDEIQLVGRAFTWSNARDQPTLELLDRMFVTQEWLARFPAHFLRPLSSDCSDHCPILLQVVVGVKAKRRFGKCAGVHRGRSLTLGELPPGRRSLQTTRFQAP